MNLGSSELGGEDLNHNPKSVGDNGRLFFIGDASSIGTFRSTSKLGGGDEERPTYHKFSKRHNS